MSEKNKVNEVLERLQGSNRKCRRTERKIGLGARSSNNELTENNHENVSDLSNVKNKIYNGIIETTGTRTGAYSARVYSSREELVSSNIEDRVGNEPKSESGAHLADIQDDNGGSEDLWRSNLINMIRMRTILHVWIVIVGKNWVTLSCWISVYMMQNLKF